MDKFFKQFEIFSVRYLDDILLTARSKPDLVPILQLLKDTFGLAINWKKSIISWSDSMDFLDFNVSHDGIAIADSAVLKTRLAIEELKRNPIALNLQSVIGNRQD